MAVVSSTTNSTIKAVAGLKRRKERDQTGRILVEGPTLFAAATGAGLIPEMLLVTPGDSFSIAAAERTGVVPILVTDRVLASVADTKHPQSPVAVFDRPPPTPVPYDDVVVLVGVGDPGNAGTIIRTAVAFRWAVVTTPATVDLWSPKTLRSGAGAHFAAAISRIDGIDELADHTKVATVVSGGHHEVATGGPYALLVGSEAHGLDPQTVAACDISYTIPMPGPVESLNASVAAALAMVAISRR
ncbi:MAG: RNA methyltransferase [Acidimicrobiia bacterium]